MSREYTAEEIASGIAAVTADDSEKPKLKFWALGGHWFLNFFDIVVLPVNKIERIAFNREYDPHTSHHGNVAHVYVEGTDEFWTFDGEHRDEILKFCQDRE